MVGNEILQKFSLELETLPLVSLWIWSLWGIWRSWLKGYYLCSDVWIWREVEFLPMRKESTCVWACTFLFLQRQWQNIFFLPCKRGFSHPWLYNMVLDDSVMSHIWKITPPQCFFHFTPAFHGWWPSVLIYDILWMLFRIQTMFQWLLP